MSKKEKTEKAAAMADETPLTDKVSEADAASAADATEAKAEEVAAPDGKDAKSAEPAEPDWKTLYALTLADFDNYKKRAARDREETYRYAEMDILKDVLPVVDNLALALANAKNNVEDPFVKGVQLVYDTLLKSLADHGAAPFDSVGKDLDIEKMEAIATLPSAEVAEGKVAIESKKGWMLHEKVLRAAQVVVSSGSGEKGDNG